MPAVSDRPRLTFIQASVLRFMAHGWTLESALISHGGYLRKPGEAQRHVRWNTLESLFEHAYITSDQDHRGHWVRNEYWIEKSGVRV